MILLDYGHMNIQIKTASELNTLCAQIFSFTGQGYIECLLNDSIILIFFSWSFFSRDQHTFLKIRYKIDKRDFISYICKIL